MNKKHLESLITVINKKKLIFTVTTGRSGTGYLANILDFLPGVASFHEPDPQFVDVLRSVLLTPHIAKDFWLNNKFPQIIQQPHSVYIETSHLICKGFLEPLLDMGLIPDLIILTRPHRDVALSLFKLQTIPGRSEKAIRFYLAPDDPGVLPLPQWQKLHDYQLCYWYCLEIERRCKYYEQIFSALNACVAKVTLDEINTDKGIYNLLKQLKLPRFNILFWLNYFLSKRKKVNTKDSLKTSLSLLPAKLDNLEKEVRQIVYEI